MKRHSDIVQTIDVDDFYIWCELMCELCSAMRYPIDGINSAPMMCPVFRGQENAEWEITSTFERTYKGVFFPVDKDRELFLRIKELALIASFKRDAMQYLEHEPHDVCEWLSLMRHYGAPTRIVDFTESPFVALHFALSDKSESAFAVWSFPAKDGYWARKIAKASQKKMGSFVTDTQKDRVANREAKCAIKMASVIPIDEERDMLGKREYLMHILGRTRHGDPVKCNKKDAMVLIVKPQFNNARICAQAGVLAIPTVLSETFMYNAKQTGIVGALKIPRRAKISDLRKERVACLSPNSFTKFVFQPDMRSTARAFLNAANITERTLFPDIEGMARQFKPNRLIDLL